MFWNFISSLLVKRRRIPFIFDNFHFLCSRVIGLVIIRYRVKILFSVISSPITLERQEWKSSKMKGILLLFTSKLLIKFLSSLLVKRRRIPFIFDNFHFLCSRVIGLDMTENRIFTLCRMITWVVFLRKFQNILRNTTQVIIRHRVKILFSVISSSITLERQEWKWSKRKGILHSSPVSCW
jgi:lipid-A-disaccharide synthase-like uncharacterized protein